MPFKVTDNETGNVISFENKPNQTDIDEAFGVSRKQVEGEPSFRDIPSNIPSSAIKAGSNILKAVTSPIETVDTLRDLVLGGIAKGVDPIGSKEEKLFDQTVELFKDRYGSLENVKKTAIEDPVGFLLDASGIISGVGSATSLAGKAGKVSAIAKTGRAISKTAQFIDPINVVGKGVGAIAKARKPVNTLIKTAFEFNPKGTPAQRLKRIDELAQAVLDNPEITVSRKSLLKVNNKRKSINNNINSIIDDAQKGGPLNVQKIVDNIDDLIDTSKAGGLEDVGLRKMESLKQEFINSSGTSMTPVELQSLKKGLNQAFKADTKGTFEAVIGQVRKAKRQGARQLLEEINPELKALNKNDGIFNEIEKAINIKLIQIEQQPIVASKGLAAGATGGLVAGAETVSPAQAVKFGIGASLFSKIVDSPRLQIALAKALSKARLTIAKSGQIQKFTQPAFQAGRVEQQQQPQITR